MGFKGVWPRFQLLRNFFLLWQLGLHKGQVCWYEIRLSLSINLAAGSNSDAGVIRYKMGWKWKAFAIISPAVTLSPYENYPNYDAIVQESIII